MFVIRSGPSERSHHNDGAHYQHPEFFIETEAVGQLDVEWFEQTFRSTSTYLKESVQTYSDSDLKSRAP